jgi:hypothetical protein
VEVIEVSTYITANVALNRAIAVRFGYVRTQTPVDWKKWFLQPLDDYQRNRDRRKMCEIIIREIGDYEKSIESYSNGV